MYNLFLFSRGNPHKIAMSKDLKVPSRELLNAYVFRTVGEASLINGIKLMKKT